MIYLDNAATTYPKPSVVKLALSEALQLYGANPGRSGHDDSMRTACRVYEAREKLNSFFNGYGAQNVAFTYNCTYALNMAIKGAVYKGCHIVISSLEHNSVVRPVVQLARDGVCTYSTAAVYDDMEQTIESFKEAVTPETGIIVCTHASNVFGTLLPIKQIAEIAAQAGATFIVDAAQSAGIADIDIRATGIDCLCVPGHKSLYGIMGTGALLFNEKIKNTVIEGGTGTRSFDTIQPEEYPDRLESGTVNVPGIVSLLSGVGFVEQTGTENIRAHEANLMKYLYNELSQIRGVVLYGSGEFEKSQLPILSFNCRSLHSEQTAQLLNLDGIAVRAGFHCAPLAHISNGTQNTGTVRVAPSLFTIKKDVNNLINSVRKIAN